MPKVVLPIVTPELLVALVSVASTIAAVIVVDKWKKKTINLVGVR